MKRTAMLLSVVALVAVSASASARPKDPADQRFQEGVAFAKEGKYKEAREAFLQAYALHQDSTTLWNLALSEMKSELPLAAVRHLRDYLKRDDRDPANVSAAPQLLERLRGQVSELAIEAPPEAEVRVDGERVGDRAPLEGPVVVAPGPHVVEAQLGTKVVRADATTALGATTPVHLVFGESAAETPPPGPPPSSLTSPPKEAPQSASAVRYVVPGALIAVSAGAIVAGAVLAGAARDDKSEADSLQRANPGACSDRSSAPCTQITDLASSRDTKATWSTVSYVGGGVVAGVGVGWLVYELVSKPDARAAQVLPMIGPGVAGGAMSLRF